MRMVKAKYWNVEEGRYKEVRGLFHQWGLALAENRDQITNYTVAIIEDRGEDIGTIRKCFPEDVIFEDIPVRNIY